MSIFAAVLDLVNPGLRVLVARNHLARSGVAVDTHAIAHLPAKQLIHRHPQCLAGQIPERDFNAGERGDVLAGLRSGEDARRANPFEGGLDVERILADEQARERSHERHAAHGGVGRFTLPEEALVGIHADVDLITVHPDFGRADFGDFQLRAVVRCTRRLHGGRERRPSSDAGHRQQSALQQGSATRFWHRVLRAVPSSAIIYAPASLTCEEFVSRDQ
jgi:hypothetical protein